jgi:hypothetical protein
MGPDATRSLSINPFGTATVQNVSVLPDRFTGTSIPVPGQSLLPEEFRTTSAPRVTFGTLDALGELERQRERQPS